MRNAAQASRLFETVFRRIQRERMAGVPLLNPALEVRSVGFTPWQQGFVGVLITPWFMNLMWLPQDDDAWSALQPGSTRIRQFPSGAYPFILARETDIGSYQMCSLFSPVFEFPDLPTAVATARSVMEHLMDETHRDPGPTRTQDTMGVWGGASAATAAADVDGRGSPRSSARIDQPMSRRDLIRGAFLVAKE